MSMDVFVACESVSQESRETRLKPVDDFVGSRESTSLENIMSVASLDSFAGDLNPGSHQANIGLDLLLNNSKRRGGGGSVAGSHRMGQEREHDRDAMSIRSAARSDRSGAGIMKSSPLGHQEKDEVLTIQVPESSGGGGRNQVDSAKVRNWMSSAESDVSSVKSKRSAKVKANNRDDDKDAEDRLARRPRNELDAQDLKREILYEMDRLRAKGIRLPRMYSLDTSLEELQGDYLRIKRNREMDAGVMFQRQALMTCVSGIEFLSTHFSPFDVRLEGWSHHVSDSLDSYDDILEELYVKYRGKAKFAPELRLLMALGGSAVMFSMQNRLASLAEGMLSGQGGQSAAGPRGQRSSSGSGPGSGIMGAIGSLLGNLFSGQQQSGPSGPQQNPGYQNHQQYQQQPQHEQQQQAPRPMRGPTLNVDSILRNIQQNAFDGSQRVEIVSTISESDVPDDASILSGAFPSIVTKNPAAASAGNKSKKSTLNLT
jgi:hypothetical protein